MQNMFDKLYVLCTRCVTGHLKHFIKHAFYYKYVVSFTNIFERLTVTSGHYIDIKEVGTSYNSTVHWLHKV